MSSFVVGLLKAMTSPTLMSSKGMFSFTTIISYMLILGVMLPLDTTKNGFAVPKIISELENNTAKLAKIIIMPLRCFFDCLMFLHLRLSLEQNESTNYPVVFEKILFSYQY